MTTSAAAGIYPDVLHLAQQIADETSKLVLGVESLDANNWLAAADKIDSLNSQLQALIIPTPSSTKSTKS